MGAADEKANAFLVGNVEQTGDVACLLLGHQVSRLFEGGVEVLESGAVVGASWKVASGSHLRCWLAELT